MSLRHRVRAVVVALAALATASAPTGLAASPGPPQAAWEQWLHLPGVFDLAGPRADGRLVAAVHGRLVLVGQAGATSDFAPSYSAPDGPESYIALSPGMAVEGAGCSFPRDEVLALDLTRVPAGVARISSNGAVSHLADVTGATTLTGLALDTVGRFGHRLLVVGPAEAGKTQVSGIDCRGRVASIGVVDTPLEGGMAVAPRSFGPYGGQLVAADELRGSIYAVSPSGRLSAVAASGVPAGGDIGVESAGFVPATGVAAAYLADRGTPGNPHPGTDSVLRLTGAALRASGVRPGDLLVATEGGATVVGVRCARRCLAKVVATGPPAAHGEGRLLAVTPTAGRGGGGPAAFLVVAAGLAALAGLSLLAVSRARRSRRP